MRITHVLRGEDLLSSTPRQLALYAALVELGIAETVPRFGHLPYVMGEGNKKLSKRDPQGNLLNYRENGGIHVLLLWSRTTDALSVLVVDTKTEEHFAFRVHASEAMDAFRHPFAYAASRGAVHPCVALLQEEVQQQ